MKRERSKEHERERESTSKFYIEKKNVAIYRMTEWGNTEQVEMMRQIYRRTPLRVVLKNALVNTLQADVCI